MDEYRSDAVLRHFHSRSTGLCGKAPLHTIPININFYMQYDSPKIRPESVGDRFLHVGAGRPPSQNNMIQARKTAQTYMADN